MLHLTFALKNKMNLRETDVVSNYVVKLLRRKIALYSNFLR